MLNSILAEGPAFPSSRRDAAVIHSAWLGGGGEERRSILVERGAVRAARRIGRPARGVPRVDDRRVVSGIVELLHPGCRWKDAPALHGPRTTLDNRFVRWAGQGD